MIRKFDLEIPTWMILLSEIIQTDYMHKLHKKTGITYSCVSRNISIFRQKKLVDVRMDGKKNILTLTKEGEIIAYNCLSTLNILKNKMEEKKCLVK